MTNITNQTQIESTEAAVTPAAIQLFYSNTKRRLDAARDAIVLDYAIDLAPIIAERDRMKAALETIQDRACDSRVDHYMADFIYDACRAALEPKP